MCTASLIALGDDAWRFVFNRDEATDRAPAAPPVRRELGGVSCAWPVDGAAGGTWIGASARGLVLALLNRNAAGTGTWQRRLGLRSRGLLIPELLAAADAETAFACLSGERLRDFAPFSLVAIDDHRALSAVWDGTLLHGAAHPRAAPVMWASSGYGDERVRPARCAAFSAVEAAPDARRQDAFHAGREGGDPVAWVAMRRADARSVSRTTIVVDHAQIALRYAPLDEDGAESEAAELIIPRAG